MPTPRKLLPLLLAACAGCTVSTDSGVLSLGFGTRSWVLTDSASERRAVDLDLGPGDELVVEGGAGAIVVHTTADRPRLVAHVTASGRREEEAEAALRAAEIRVERTADTVSVRVVVEDVPDEARVSVDFDVLVPARIRIRMTTSAGDIEAEGPFAAATAKTSFGRVSVSDVEGDASLLSASGDIVLQRVTGAERARASTSYGRVEVRDVRAEELRASSSSGDIVISDVTCGRIEVKSSYGAVELVRAVGTIQATSQSGRVLLEDVSGAVDASSGYGRVEIEGIFPQVRASSSSGNIRVDAGPGSTAAKPWEIETGYGAIEVILPAGFSCRLEAKTSFGSIETEFDLTRSGRPGGRGVRGSIGTGGELVGIHTSSGDITLRRGGD